MSQIDNPRHVQRKEAAIRIGDRQRIADIGFVMSSPAGRRMFNDLLSRCGIARLSYSGPGRAEDTAFYEGQRNIGNYYYGVLTKNFKNEWLLMTEEAERKEEITNGGNRDSTNRRIDHPDDSGADASE